MLKRGAEENYCSDGHDGLIQTKSHERHELSTNSFPPELFFWLFFKLEVVFSRDNIAKILNIWYFYFTQTLFSAVTVKTISQEGLVFNLNLESQTGNDSTHEHDI